jgi:hypothetical protein
MRRLRALRLRAPADAPTAFGSTLAREEAFTDDVWRDRAAGGASGTDRVAFIAERDGRWIGLASGLAADLDTPDRGEPVLVGMLVRGRSAAAVSALPSSRRRSPGRRLLR